MGMLMAILLLFSGMVSETYSETCTVTARSGGGQTMECHQTSGGGGGGPRIDPNG